MPWPAVIRTLVLDNNGTLIVIGLLLGPASRNPVSDDHGNSVLSPDTEGWTLGHLD